MTSNLATPFAKRGPLVSSALLSVLVCLQLSSPLLAQTALPSTRFVEGSGHSASQTQGVVRVSPECEVLLASGDLHLQFHMYGLATGGEASEHTLSLTFRSLSVDWSGDFTGGFDLGPGWSSTVGGRLIPSGQGSITLTSADGQQTEFIHQSGQWTAETGSQLSLEPRGGGWIVRDWKQEEVHFDATGRQTAVVSAKGRVHEIEFSAGKVSRLTAPTGDYVNFQYTSTGRLQQATHSTGATWQMGYDAAGRLNSILDPSANDISLTYDGTVEWSYPFFTSIVTPHHDIEVMPNGNLLLTAWEELGGAGAVAAGRNPATVGTSFMPDAIYELQPVGDKDAIVVWEWHPDDHFVQDFDSNLPNFGVVADHPELIDVNFGHDGDWMHVNGIDYNADLDQIAISVPNFNEVWIIDHSTTTAEAATHSGGNSGKGGDLLYRWGNPAVYGRGVEADRRFFFIHDVQWIEPGLPGAGNLLIYNNGQNRPVGGNWSSVDEWAPPVDAQGNYSLASGQAYGPTSLEWTYSDQGNFYSAIMSGCERLANGNTLICEATSGRMFEVDSSGSILWTHINPAPGLNWVFKARRYGDCDTNGVFDGDQIANGASDTNGNGELDSCETPENYCSASTNSSGQAAQMGWAGSTSLAANDLDLIATGCPASVFGLFAYSPNQGSLPLGEGTLCLSAPFTRLPVLMTDGAGVANFDFDNQNLPLVSPALTAGTEWNFTFWFRDVSGGPAGFNLSDGLAVLFVQ